MAADEQGFDLDAVGVPISGLAAFAPVELENVIAKAALGAKPMVLPDAYKKIGLFKQDGGPAETRESGDPLEFFQQGYKIAGEGSRSLAITTAELNAAIRQLTEGAVPDENGVIEVSASLPGNRYILFSATKFRGGAERRREGVAFVSAVEPDQEERGAINGSKITFTWLEHELFNGAPFWEFYGTPGATP